VLAFDASSILHCWEVYPTGQFPKFWEWMGERVQDRAFVVPEVALFEAKDAYDWLKENGVTVLKPNNEALALAVALQQTLGILEHGYSAKGVDENDLIVVATAKVNDVGLVTEEAPQLQLPTNKCKFKMPAVCELPEVGVKWKRFNSVLRDSGRVF
jgi:hypothetical protein